MKILLLDIETAFNIAAVWGRFKQNVAMSQVLQERYILCWAAKWYNDPHIYSDSLHNHKDLFSKDPTDDSAVCQTMWDMMDEADLIVGHNGKGFDIPVLNSRFLVHGFKPPSSYHVFDTLLSVRRNFSFLSNKLDDLGQTLSIGQKLDTDFNLWLDCVVHKKQAAYKRMVDYNEQDVMLLEALYEIVRPWDKTHPYIAGFDSKSSLCPVCGSDKLQKKGFRTTTTQRYQRFLCTKCGHSSRARSGEKIDPDVKKNILRSC